MSKSYALSKELREQLLRQLVQQAVSKHGKRISDELKSINEEFWSGHVERVKAMLGLPQKKWVELMQAGLLATVYSEEPTIPGHGNPVVFSTSYRDEHLVGIWRTALAGKEFSGVGGFIQPQRHSSRTMCLVLKSPNGTLPRFNGMFDLAADSVLVRRMNAVRDELASVFKAAEDFHAKAKQVLDACRTTAQLESLFPEAAKLLPKRAEDKIKALAPVALANSVRAMLEAGVPDALA